MIRSIIVGTGSYIPPKIVPNSKFEDNIFYGENGERLKFDRKSPNFGEIIPNKIIIEKFREITGINSRRYVDDNLVASDIGFFAAKNALESSHIDPETLDYIIVAHNFGDVKFGNRRSDFVPTLAARIKNKLGIKNPKCIAQDLPFGCPGWLQGMIMADYLIRSGYAKRVIIIGTETLSRVCDPYDRDSMIYADGAGATILEAYNVPYEIKDMPDGSLCAISKVDVSKTNIVSFEAQSMPDGSTSPIQKCFDNGVGILSHAVRSDTIDHSNLLWMGPSYNPSYQGNDLFLKMNGNALYKYALRYVPGVVKQALDKVGLQLSDVSKLCIHQANEKMDYAILEEICKIYNIKEIPWNIMPMTINEFGNSSVATIPTLLDLILRGNLEGHSFKSGDIVVFASVGAGMNINVVVYRVP